MSNVYNEPSVKLQPLIVRLYKTPNLDNGMVPALIDLLYQANTVKPMMRPLSKVGQNFSVE